MSNENKMATPSLLEGCSLEESFYMSYDTTPSLNEDSKQTVDTDSRGDGSPLQNSSFDNPPTRHKFQDQTRESSGSLKDLTEVNSVFTHTRKDKTEHQHIALQKEILQLNHQNEILKQEKLEALQRLREANKNLIQCQRENEDSKIEATKMSNSLKLKVKELTALIKEFKKIYEDTDHLSHLEAVQRATSLSLKQRDDSIRRLENDLTVIKLECDRKEQDLNEIISETADMRDDYEMSLQRKDEDFQKLRNEYLAMQAEFSDVINKKEADIVNIEKELEESQEEALRFMEDNALLRVSLGMTQDEISELKTDILDLTEKLELTHHERDDLEGRCVEMYEAISKLEGKEIKKDFVLVNQTMD